MTARMPGHPWWRRWLPALLIAGSPCLAAGIAAADIFLLPGGPIAGVGDDVVGVNGTLAFSGAAAGGSLSRGRILRKLALGVGAGVVGACAYVVLLLGAVALAPRPIG